MTGFQRIDLGLTDANAACSCCATGDSHGADSHGSSSSIATTPTRAEGALSAEFLVEGMTCSHCVSSVTEELSEVDGVQQVAVDLRPGAASVVTVTSSGPISDDAVRAAVEEAGYTLAAQGA
ncbi:heavy-metal-associated domain-containing protein [Agromyces sp. H66]|uniref:heavy-metal-associated domain-containing protein n=1 Tax=Agromyces sp. H66 TaxID=2529859 RepID=UPI0010AACA08|nr:heavy-metal-associated domain-containing protein [Agromyces sp. H66]